MCVLAFNSKNIQGCYNCIQRNRRDLVQKFEVQKFDLYPDSVRNFGFEVDGRALNDVDRCRTGDLGCGAVARACRG